MVSLDGTKYLCYLILSLSKLSILDEYMTKLTKAILKHGNFINVNLSKDKKTLRIKTQD